MLFSLSFHFCHKNTILLFTLQVFAGFSYNNSSKCFLSIDMLFLSIFNFIFIHWCFIGWEGTVFQTAAFFLSVIPRLRPGLLSLCSVQASSLICCLVVWLFGCLVVWLFSCLVVWLFSCLVECNNIAHNKTTKSQNHKTTKS